MFANAYIFDKLLQAITLSLVFYVLVENDMTYFLILFIAAFSVLVVLDALQGKVGYYNGNLTDGASATQLVAVQPIKSSNVSNIKKAANANPNQPLKLTVKGGSLDQTRLYEAAPIPLDPVYCVESDSVGVGVGLGIDRIPDYITEPNEIEIYEDISIGGAQMTNSVRGKTKQTGIASAPYCADFYPNANIIRQTDDVHGELLNSDCLSECQPCGLSDLPVEYKVALKDRIIYGNNYRECGEMVTTKVENNLLETPTLNLAKESYLPTWPVCSSKVMMSC